MKQSYGSRVSDNNIKKPSVRQSMMIGGVDLKDKMRQTLMANMTTYQKIGTKNAVNKDMQSSLQQSKK